MILYEQYQNQGTLLQSLSWLLVTAVYLICHIELKKKKKPELSFISDYIGLNM